MPVGKRLYRYATLFKGLIIAALVMLTVSVVAELTGPFVAKAMIDNHILGIEKPWYETTDSKDGVKYEGALYKRQDHFEKGETRGQEVRILQVGREFYFVGQAVPLSEGKRTVASGELTVRQADAEQSYPAAKLSVDELLAFYEPEIRPLIRLALFYFALVAFAAILHYFVRYLLQNSANKIIQKMREDVFAHIQRLPINYFDNLPAGKVVARVTNDTEVVRELYVTVLANFFTSAITMTGIFAAMFLLDVRLAAICMLLVPILFVWIKLYRKYSSKLNHRIRSLNSDINGMINESIQGMPVIQAFGREKQMAEEFDEMNVQHFQSQGKLMSLNALTNHNLVNVIRNIAFVVLIWYFGGQAIGAEGVVTVGVLYAFVDYLNRLFQPVVGVVNQLSNLEQALVSAERVFELMDEPGVEVDERTLPRYRGNVTFENVCFAYKNDEYVLKNIDFKANQGETVALVGHTGSGKSSIMNLLFRFYDVKQGRITIDGTDIRDWSQQQLRQHMAIVLQDPFLFTGTVASNVSLDAPGITREMVEKALKDVGAEQLLRTLPKGYDEPVLEKGSTLSAGQRQLISFARALVFNPAILILDEATANIDTETEAIIQAGLDVLKKGRTTFIIAHRLSTIKSADQILVLDHGVIVERGNHDELMQKQGKYYQMYQMQQGGHQVLA